MNKQQGFVSILLAGITLFSLATPALAETTDGTVELTEGGGVNGPLALEKTPDFDFGSQEISTSLQTYMSDGSFPLTVSDLRGTGAGWTIMAKITEFKDGGTTLLGAQFTLPSVQPTSPGTGDGPNDGIKTVLNSSDQMILTANEKSGLGQWEAQYNKAELAIPTGNYVGNYTATLEWTLIDQPVTAP